jgi:two-component system, response regulator RegA
MTKETICIVDDDPMVRLALAERCKSEGYAIAEATSASEALQRVRAGVDLILLDRKLPDADGLALIEDLKRIDPELRVILMTAFGSIESGVESIRRGAFHYLTKPFDMSIMVDTVREALSAGRKPDGNGGFQLPATGVDIEQLECDLVKQALERCGGNQTRAAALLGMNRDQIRYRIAKFHLDDVVPRRLKRVAQ